MALGDTMSKFFSQCPKCSALNKISTEKMIDKAPACGKCGANLNLHGLVSDVTAQNFRKILSIAEGVVVADFWASWCGPCKSYAPEYQKASIQNTHAVFVKVNTEIEQQLSAEYGIRGIPCTILFKHGKEVKRQSGVMSAEQVKYFIS
jgi:thioredoxin 2